MYIQCKTGNFIAFLGFWADR